MSENDEESYQQGQLRVTIATMVRALVDDEFYVLVRITQEPIGNYAVVVLVKKDDLGKVIGKQGRTARSLRTIIGAFATKEKIRVSLDIQELTLPL